MHDCDRFLGAEGYMVQYGIVGTRRQRQLECPAPYTVRTVLPRAGCLLSPV
jgi:hypothetical protein